LQFDKIFSCAKNVQKVHVCDWFDVWEPGWLLAGRPSLLYASFLSLGLIKKIGKMISALAPFSL